MARIQVYERLVQLQVYFILKHLSGVTMLQNSCRILQSPRLCSGLRSVSDILCSKGLHDKD